MRPEAQTDMTERLRSLGSRARAGRGGVVSICSARPEVLEAAAALAAEADGGLLVEATANQVNPQGGYTGLTPETYRAAVERLSAACGLPPPGLAVGADHLGPYAWRSEPADRAMAAAINLAARCVSAGFQKIHLDTGIGCADDPREGLAAQTAAARAALICRAAESAADALAPGSPRPFYVIGAEVPLPGGSLEGSLTVAATRPAEVLEALHATQAAFRAAGLEEAWERVIAVVVQPGVDFGDTAVALYDSERARELSELHAALPGDLAYEVHATDYQPAEALAALVRDRFALLKVGPCLTFAFREAVFALAAIESEWLTGRRSHQPSLLRPTLERAMKQNPAHWKNHYRGPRSWQRYLRAYSFRDRIRYYWTEPAVAAALERLYANLDSPIPLGLVQQFFPDLAAAVQRGELAPRPRPLIRRRIQQALKPYIQACGGR